MRLALVAALSGAVSACAADALAEPSVTPDDARADRWSPSPGTSWQWQLQGTIDTSVDVDVFDIDLFDVSEETIAELHAAGRRVICYTSAGTREAWRPDADAFPPEAVGRPMLEWEGEAWLDVGRIDLLQDVMTARFDLAAAKGCDAIEADNVDGWMHPTGFDLTQEDLLAYLRFLIGEAHERGLAFGLKNAVALVPDLVDEADFAINESCWTWNECDRLVPFVDAGKAVFGAEYGHALEEFCPRTNALDLDFIRKERSLGVYREACR